MKNKLVFILFALGWSFSWADPQLNWLIRHHNLCEKDVTCTVDGKSAGNVNPGCSGIDNNSNGALALYNEMYGQRTSCQAVEVETEDGKEKRRGYECKIICEGEDSYSFERPLPR